MDQENIEQEIRNARKKKTRKKRIKKVSGYIIFIIIAGALIFFWQFHNATSRFPWQPSVENNMAVTEQTTTVKKERYTSKIDLSGHFEANDTQNVMMRASGAVEEVTVKEGDRVAEGQLLARLDSSEQEYVIANIKSQIKQTQLTGNAATERLLEMQLKTAKKNLDFTKAYAAFDGVVIKVNTSAGDYSAAGQSLMVIIDDHQLKATVEIDEIDAGLITEGMDCSLTSDSVKTGEFSGRISYIPMIGRYTTSGIGVMDVEIKVDDVPEGLKPGFSFEGYVESESSQEMLLVDQRAVNNGTVTRRDEDGTEEVVPVEVRFLGEGVYQIIQGDVKEGDVLVYSSESPVQGERSNYLSVGKAN